MKKKLLLSPFIILLIFSLSGIAFAQTADVVTVACGITDTGGIFVFAFNGSAGVPPPTNPACAQVLADLANAGFGILNVQQSNGTPSGIDAVGEKFTGAAFYTLKRPLGP